MTEIFRIDIPSRDLSLNLRMICGTAPYSKKDLVGGSSYVGQAKNESRYLSRQAEHARANPDADFEFDILGRENPGKSLDRMEEHFIRQGGGPTNKGNPNGGLANRRHQMNDTRYREAGGDL